MLLGGQIFRETCPKGDSHPNLQHFTHRAAAVAPTSSQTDDVMQVTKVSDHDIPKRVSSLQGRYAIELKLQLVTE
jgi:hypothetical protein